MRYTQPQGFRQVDWDNPLTRGLGFCFFPEPAPLRGVVGEKYTDFFGDGQSQSVVRTPLGLALSNNASINYRILASAKVSGNLGFSSLVLCTPQVANAVLNPYLLNDDGAGWQAACVGYGDGTNSRFCLRYNGSGVLSATANATLGKSIAVVGVSSLTTQSLYLDGTLNASTAVALGNPTFLRSPVLYSPSATAGTILTHIALVWARPLSAWEVKSLSDNPWQIFKDEQDYSFLQAPAGAGVSASATWTEANDTASISASVLVSGNTTWTEANDVSAISGGVGSSVSASLSWTEENDVSALTSAVSVNASSIWTESNDTTNISVSVGNAVSANATWTEAADLLSSSAFVNVIGTVSSSEASDVLAVGVSLAITSSLLLIEQNDTTTINSFVAIPVTCSLVLIEENDIASINAISDVSNQQQSSYGGKLNRDDVEKWWELVELRNAEEAKSQVIQPAIEAKAIPVETQTPSIDHPVPDIQLHNPFAAPLLLSAPIQLSPSSDAVKPKKVPNDDALILLLLNM